MKKFLSCALSCLLLCTLAASALANGYGLLGGIYDIVTTGNRYEGYVCYTADDGNKQVQGLYVNHAILENRYHRVLIAAYRDGSVWKTLNAATTAVYQPGDARGEYPNTPTLSHTANGFTLQYGDTERYTFVWEDGMYVLNRVNYDVSDGYANSYVTSAEGFQFWQSGMDGTFTPVGDAIWNTDGISLGEFNITQMPRSLAEMRRLNAVRALLDEGDYSTTAVFNIPGEEKGKKLAVYSAPDEDSYRSSEGKASMSTGGQYAVWGEENGWTMISYEVSTRTSRIGYVHADLADGVELSWAEIPMTAAVDTFLTDDPFVSQFAQAYIPAGAQVNVLTRSGEYYAYVAWEQNGQPIRGFVPMKDLQPLYDTAMTTGRDFLYTDSRWDVMDALIGKWTAQDSADRSRMILYSGGVYRNHMPGDGSSFREEGNFRVFDAGDGSYELLIVTEANEEYHYALTLNPEGTITLTDDAGVSTVYERGEYSTFGNG